MIAAQLAPYAGDMEMPPELTWPYWEPAEGPGFNSEAAFKAYRRHQLQYGYLESTATDAQQGNQ